MKKSLIIALALVFVLGIAGTAFAAANPFVDVPAKHWAYESVAKLAKAGIVDGYGDGTFRGDRTMTRYEMAVVVAKAMANEDKANAAQKAEIAKLQAEFSDELTKLGVRVSALENKVGNIKFTGEVRERYEYQKDLPAGLASSASKNPAFRTRFRLGMEAKVDEGWTFKGRYVAENGAGSMDATTSVDRAYLTGKPFGLDEFALGRQQFYSGQGLVLGRSTRYYDGVRIAFGGNEVKAQLGTGKSNQTAGPVANPNMEFADLKFNFTKNFNLTTSYAKDKDSSVYKTWSTGLSYSAIPNLTINGEYGKNSADNAKYNGNDSKGWFAQVKYAGASPKKVNSFGMWVAYSKADPNFDRADLTSFDSPSIYSAMFNNNKGIEYGVEWTVFQNGVFTLMYNDWKSVGASGSGATLVPADTPRKNLVANLVYTF